MNKTTNETTLESNDSLAARMAEIRASRQAAGRKGGRACGPSKARSGEALARCNQARREQAARLRAAKLAGDIAGVAALALALGIACVMM